MRHLSIVSIFFLTSFTTIACGGAPFGSFPGGPDGSQNDAGDAETSTVTIGPPDATTSRDSGEQPDATKDAPDANGFYEITVITGEANGVAITGLQPPGTSIPGNDGYPVDNLVRTEAPRLTMHGFGYALSNGTYANPFYGAHFAKPDYYAFFSDPANRSTSEPSVAFTATIAP